MTRKIILMSVLGLVATGCLFSTVIAQPKDNPAPAQSTTPKDIVITPGSKVICQNNGNDAVVKSNEGMKAQYNANKKCMTIYSKGSAVYAAPAVTGAIGMMPPETWSQEMIKLHRTLSMLKAIGDTAFDPESAALIGIGAINDECALTPQEAAAELELVLQSTQSLGLRNAIRITLKDIYLKAGDKKKALEHMRAMIAENDKCMYDNEKSERGEANKK